MSEDKNMKPNAFFVKCRPFGDIDALDVALKHKIAFVGYARRAKKPSGPPNELKGKLISPLDERVEELSIDSGRMYTMVGNLVSEVNEGDYVLIPRPQSGMVYIGKIKERLQLAKNNPKWAKQYLKIREKSGYEEEKEPWKALAEIAQYWRIDGDYVDVPFALFPRWISYRFLSRHMTGWIHDLNENLQASKVIERLYKGYLDSNPAKNKPIRPDDEEEIRHRLMDFVTPSIFEQLCVDLLNLEDSDIFWQHVGGSGDGGVDGIGMTKDANVHGFLQCKLHFSGDPKSLLEEMRENAKPYTDKNRSTKVTPKKFVLASLYGAKDDDWADTKDLNFIDGNELAKLFARHADKMPLNKLVKVDAASS